MSYDLTFFAVSNGQKVTHVPGTSKPDDKSFRRAHGLFYRLDKGRDARVERMLACVAKVWYRLNREPGDEPCKHHDWLLDENDFRIPPGAYDGHINGIVPVQTWTYGSDPGGAVGVAFSWAYVRDAPDYLWRFIAEMRGYGYYATDDDNTYYDGTLESDRLAYFNRCAAYAHSNTDQCISELLVHSPGTEVRLMGAMVGNLLPPEMLVVLAEGQKLVIAGKHAEALPILAGLWEQSKNVPLRLLQKALIVDRLAEALEGLGRDQEALELLLPLLDLPPMGGSCGMFRVRAGLIYLRLGDTARATELFGEAMDSDTDEVFEEMVDEEQLEEVLALAREGSTLDEWE